MKIMLVTLAILSMSAAHADKKHHQIRQEIRQDRKELHQDRQNLRQDRQERRHERRESKSRQ